MRFVILSLPLVLSSCGAVVVSSEKTTPIPPKHISYAIYQIDRYHNETTLLYNDCISLERGYDSASIIVDEHYGDDVVFRYDLDPDYIAIEVYSDDIEIAHETFSRTSFMDGSQVSVEFTTYDGYDHRMDLTGPECIRY